MARRQQGTRLSVFTGREAKLNQAIFQALALEGPQTTYEIWKDVRATRSLKHTKYTNVNRRVRALEQTRYLEKMGEKETKAGFTTTIFKLTCRAYLALLLSHRDLDAIVQSSTTESIVTILAALTQA